MFITADLVDHSFSDMAAMLKRGRTPPTNNPALEFRTADSEHVFKRTRAFGISDEVRTTLALLYITSTRLKI